MIPDESQALIAAPDSTTCVGRRDHALLDMAIDTGLRVSELVNLKCEDLVIDESGPAGKPNFDFQYPAVAPDFRVDGLAGPFLPEERGGPSTRRHDAAVELEQHVARLKPGARGRPVIRHG